MNLNKAMLMGRLGHPPSMRESSAGTAVCKFSLATNHRQKSGDKWEDVTTWHNVTCFGKTAENCKQYLDKGSAVLVEGRIENSKYEKDGETKYYSQVIAESVKFLSSKQDKQDSDVVPVENDNTPF